VGVGPGIFWVGARDEDAAVVEEDGFGVVEAVDCGVGHDAEAAVYRLAGVVEDGIVVWKVSESEAGETLHGAVEDNIGTIWKGSHASDDSNRGLVSG
jgi:hypothetical protein